MTTKTDKASALDQLRELCPPNTTVHTVVRHVTSSGMGRTISAFVIKDNQLRDLDWLINKADIGFKADSRRPGLKVGGAGMDMAFHLVYTLSRALYPDGYECNGNSGYKREGGCGSNDHSNYRHWLDGDQGTWDREAGEWVGGTPNLEPNYQIGKHHSDGGYALYKESL